MRKFRTIITIPKSINQITYRDSIIFIGSCFTENIGKVIQNLGFNTHINPFGILYNPLSVSACIKNILNKKVYDSKDVFLNNDVWTSFDNHSKYSTQDKDQFIKNLNAHINSSFDFISNANFLFLTFGTSFVYSHVKTGKIVANCHKIASSNFERKLLDIEEIVEEYDELLKSIFRINPNINIVFTISPVRHLKDGAEQNNLSKSILKVSINEIQKIFPQTTYFPSYEIMMDDLRDYRFYNDDMLHPSNLAIEYIWDMFAEAYFDEATRKISDQISKILKSVEHRPFNPNSESYRKFLDATSSEIKKIKETHPDVKVDLLLEKLNGKI